MSLSSLSDQTGRKAETIILPLELLRQLKPSEFTDASEYHHWQRRQLKALEAGLSLHPSVPLDHLNSAALRLREVVRSSEHKPIDVTKNSEAMRTLCGAAITLGWRSPNNSPASEACHWADGYPLNVHLYLSLIRSIFDLRDETVVLDEVDELMELMKKTWATLGINRMMHNVCFAWALFEQYVTTGQVEPDLMCAALAMLAEVAGDAKRADKEAGFVVVASAALSSMKGWAERKLMSYHEGFEKGQIGMMESVLGLAVLVARIGEDIPSLRGGSLVDHDIGMVMSLSGNRVDQYIKSSLKNAFTKVSPKQSPTHTHARTHANGRAHTQTRTHVACAHVHPYTYAHAHTYTHICRYRHMHTRKPARTRAHAHPPKHMRTHSFTDSLSLSDTNFNNETLFVRVYLL